MPNHHGVPRAWTTVGLGSAKPMNVEVKTSKNSAPQLENSGNDLKTGTQEPEQEVTHTIDSHKHIDQRGTGNGPMWCLIFVHELGAVNCKKWSKMKS